MIPSVLIHGGMNPELYDNMEKLGFIRQGPTIYIHEAIRIRAPARLYLTQQHVITRVTSESMLIDNGAV